MTPISKLAGLTPEVLKTMEKKHPIRRNGQVSDTSNAIMFAASSAAAFVSGSNIIVDGGLLAGHPYGN